jgi:hypothetical protein
MVCVSALLAAKHYSLYSTDHKRFAAVTAACRLILLSRAAIAGHPVYADASRKPFFGGSVLMRKPFLLAFGAAKLTWSSSEGLLI